MRVAVRHATRALELLPSGPSHEERRMRLQLIRAGALLEMRDFDAARIDLDCAPGRARPNAATSRPKATRVACSAPCTTAASRLAEARLELGQAVDLLRTVDRPDLLAAALRARGFIELFGGSLVDAEWFFGEAETRVSAARRPARAGVHRAAPRVDVVPVGRPGTGATIGSTTPPTRSTGSATATAWAGHSACWRSSSSSSATSSRPRSWPNWSSREADSAATTGPAA